MCFCSSLRPPWGYHCSAEHRRVGGGFWFLAPSLKGGTNGTFPGYLYIPWKEWQLLKMLTPLYFPMSPNFRPLQMARPFYDIPSSLLLHEFHVQMNEGCLRPRLPSTSPRRRPRLMPSPRPALWGVGAWAAPSPGNHHICRTHRFQAWLLDCCPLWWATRGKWW